MAAKAALISAYSGAALSGSMRETTTIRLLILEHTNLSSSSTRSIFWFQRHNLLCSLKEPWLSTYRTRSNARFAMIWSSWRSSTRCRTSMHLTPPCAIMIHRYHTDCRLPARSNTNRSPLRSIQVIMAFLSLPVLAF